MDKLSTEQQRNIGKIKLQEYGTFLGELHNELHQFKQKLEVNSNIHLKLIKINHNGLEYAKILDLIHSDNKLLSKILASLASLLHELHELSTESERECDNLIGFEADRGNVELVLEPLLRVISIVERSRKSIALLFRHLSSILGTETRSGSTCRFPECFEYLSELLAWLIALDASVKSEPIREAVSNYRRIVENRRKEFGQRTKGLEQCLLDIDRKLTSRDIFADTVEYCSRDRNSNVDEEISSYLNEYESPNFRANALLAFQYALFGNLDKRNLRKILDSNKRALACELTAHRLWYPEDFLSKHIPIAKEINPESFKNVRRQQLLSRSQNLPGEVGNICNASIVDLIELERISRMDTTNLDVKKLQEAMLTLISTVRRVKKISETVRLILNLHANEGVPMTKTTLSLTCRLIEILKCYQRAFERNSPSIGHKTFLIMQHLTYKASKKLHLLKQDHVSEKRYKDKELDIVSALEVCDSCLRGPVTRDRLLIAKLSLSCSGISNLQLNELRSVLNYMSIVHGAFGVLDEGFDCSFLRWHHESIKLHFVKMLNAKDLDGLAMMMSAMDDYSDRPLRIVIDPLNQLIEMNLRLQTHRHLELPDIDPFKNYLPLNFRTMEISKIGTTYQDLKKELERYLSETFYNLTSVVLHDWQTYAEMRNVAYLQYEIETVKDNLPMLTLGQGIDVLEIMRNINSFVTAYAYNLNGQFFVEKQSTSKTINTVGIAHVANSIRTHGIGVMNTAVNFTYQLLQNKFYIFSQFMYDEHVKSRLIKDYKFFTERRKELNQYPYERAEKFNYAIKKLGLDEEGRSYLDLFRTLITHIGNAMGYVRLVRSGGRRCLSEAASFVPDFENVDTITDYFRQESNGLTKRAGEALSMELESLARNFEEATEYFKLFVDVFSSVFQDEKHLHLKNFFMIVPPLTINFVENSLVCKERLNKKNRDSASFTDDGFPMGLAFIVELLGQDERLNSLHWFRSISSHFADKRKAIEQQKIKDDDNLRKTLSLSETRLGLFEREYQMLFFNYKSARIFFQP